MNGIGSGIGWLGGLIKNVFIDLKTVLVTLLKPIIVFINGIVYLLTKIFDIVILIIQVIFGLFKAVGGVITGIINTLTALKSYTGTTSYYNLPSSYNEGWHGVFDILNNAGFNTLALIMMFFVWVLTAYAIIKIAGGEK